MDLHLRKKIKPRNRMKWRIHMKYLFGHALGLTMTLVGAAVAIADPVNKVDPTTLTVSEVITFSEPFVDNAGVMEFAGADFSERFQGQVLTLVFIPDPGTDREGNARGEFLARR